MIWPRPSMKSTGPDLKSGHDRNQVFCVSRCVSGSKDYGVSNFAVLYYHVPEDEVTKRPEPLIQRHCVTSRKPQNRCGSPKPRTSHAICTHFSQTMPVPAAARLLRLWVRIPPGGMDVCCVLSGRGICDGLIIRIEEAHRLWCVVVCNLETSCMRRPCPTGGCRAKNKHIRRQSCLTVITANVN